MKYDFDKIIDRRTTNALKWDGPEHEIPMWVADMDFQTAPAVIEALKRRVENGAFGYSIVPDAWYQAIIGWWERRHGYSIEKEWLIFCTGVIPAITCAVKRLTNVGDRVVVQTPVYNIFFNSILNGGRHPVENYLRYDGENYEMDFENLEQELSHPQTTLMILCNPHNPIGKIWSKEELARVGELCHKYHVTLISDEIHCDLTEPGYTYVPFASVSEVCRNISVTCIAPSKTFNLAGLQSAAVVIPNEDLRAKMERGLNSDEVAEPNAFACDAVIAAYTKGEEWLDELRSYLKANKEIVREFLQNELPQVHMVEGRATYLLWLDCSRVVEDVEGFCEYLRKEHGVYFSAGAHYHGNGTGFIRVNTACPKSQLEEALVRLKRGLQ